MNKYNNIKSISFNKKKSVPVVIYYFNRYNWTEQEYIRGAYSYIALKRNTSAMFSLKEPIARGRLRMAGEATSLYVATMAGAMLSGEQAAKGILETIKKQNE